MLDLTNQLNWNIVTRRNLQAQVTDATKGTYIPLNDLSCYVESTTLMVGLQSKSSKPRWYRGAYASMRLPILPGSNTEFVAAVEAATKVCRLNALTLIQFPDVGISNYLLILSFPYWFEDMYVEVWQYLQD